jgi:hypothetical protein
LFSCRSLSAQLLALFHTLHQNPTGFFLNYDPDPKHVSTSYVERQNLTMRMSMRRFTRLTNGFSKKLDNHAATVTLYFMYYNFARVHQTLRVTPAMEAGIADHIWSIGAPTSSIRSANAVSGGDPIAPHEQYGAER